MVLVLPIIIYEVKKEGTQKDAPGGVEEHCYHRVLKILK
jgi:hypothetical protein